MQKLIDADGVDFLLGPYSSGLTTGASASAEANNVIMVEGNGTSNTVFERGFRNLSLVATIASDYTKSRIWVAGQPRGAQRGDRLRRHLLSHLRGQPTGSAGIL